MMFGARSAGFRIRGRDKVCLTFTLFITLFAVTLGAQTNSGHKYPRTAIFQWGGAQPEWYAKFDLVMTRISDPGFISLVKQLNPNTIWLPARDFNRADEFIKGFPGEWFLRDSKGNKVCLYSTDTYYANLSDLSPAFEGKKLIAEFPKILAGIVRDANADGIASDGLYSRAHFEWNLGSAYLTDVDLDRNGLNDLTETGKGKAWFAEHWGKGVDQFLVNLRNELGDDKIIMVNTGSVDTPGITLLNGYVSEYQGGEYDWKYTRGHLSDIKSNVRSPMVCLSNQNTDGSDPQRIRPGKNDFPYVRFGLGRAMLLDQYFEFEDFDQHYWNKYYDEFDVDVGYPTGAAQQLVSRGSNDQGVWVRFFDSGAVIVNISTSDVVVTSSQLSSLLGYQGPYYRLLAGQDPTRNNGTLFDQVTLKGHGFGTSSATVSGDAIILVKTPTTVVSDILIDNSDSGTSPGSVAASFSAGFDQQACNVGSYYYTVRCAEHFSSYGFARALPGSGNATATFRPVIGVPGTYEVFEWHGMLSNSGTLTNEASNVPCTISYSGGSQTLTINQRINTNQWNSLGKYQFAQGSSGNVTITNNADGSVIADIVKFVYIGEKDTIPPVDPTGLSSQFITEKSIALTWNASITASDGDKALSYRVYRNDALQSTVTTTTYTDYNLVENTPYTYRIFAMDDAGNRSAPGTTRSFTTSMDLTAPTLSLARAVNQTSVDVFFSEPVKESTAEQTSNYSIDNQVNVLTAELTAPNTVRLTTSSHTMGSNYTVTVNNIKDMSSSQNTLRANSTASYPMNISLIRIAVACDDKYELYVNGNLIGTGNTWEKADTFSVSSLEGDNVIAIKGTDLNGPGGLVAEVYYKGKQYVTNDSWKVSTTGFTGWNTRQFNDIDWPKATTWGLHGVAIPWVTYTNVANISLTNNVYWIWSSSSQNDDVCYFRLVLGTGSDMTPPNAPVGLNVRKP